MFHMTWLIKQFLVFLLVEMCLPHSEFILRSLYHYENMTLKITLKSPITMKNHWNNTGEHCTKILTLKCLFAQPMTKHIRIWTYITLKFVCYCYPRMLIPFNPTGKKQQQQSALLISFIRSIFSVTLVFSAWFSVSYSCSDTVCQFYRTHTSEEI